MGLYFEWMLASSREILLSLTLEKRGNVFPLDNSIGFDSVYPLDGDLSSG